MNNLHIDINYITHLIIEYGEFIRALMDIYLNLKTLSNDDFNESNWSGISQEQFNIDKKNAEEQLLMYIYKLDVITQYLNLVVKDSSYLINMRDSLFTNDFSANNISSDSFFAYHMDIGFEIIQQLAFIKHDFVNVYDNVNIIDTKLSSLTPRGRTLVANEINDITTNTNAIKDVVTNVWEPTINQYSEQFNIFDNGVKQFNQYFETLLSDLLAKKATSEQILTITELVLQTTTDKQHLVKLMNQYNLNMETLTTLIDILKATDVQLQGLSQIEQKQVIKLLVKAFGDDISIVNNEDFATTVKRIIELNLPNIKEALTSIGKMQDIDQITAILLKLDNQYTGTITQIADEFKYNLYHYKEHPIDQITSKIGNDIGIMNTYQKNARPNKLSEHHGMQPRAYTPASNTSSDMAGLNNNNYKTANNTRDEQDNTSAHNGMFGMATLAACGAVLGGGMALGYSTKSKKSNSKKGDKKETRS